VKVNHHDATRLLSGYAEGALEPALARQMEQHLEDCDDCRDWLETYSFLNDGLDCARSAPSELLAQYVVDEGRLEETQRDIVREHVAACGACKEELEAIRSALEAARHKQPAHTIKRALSMISAAQPRELAIAAALVLTVLAATTFTVFRGSPWMRSEQQSQEQMTDAGAALEGDETIVIASTRVYDGANLTIHSRNTVVFGEGFSVASGATLVVGTTSSDSESNADYQ
jgi:hypothetical protein